MFTVQIQNGIELLDGTTPNWRDRMYLDTLDVASFKTCVLGQLFGDFYEGIDELGLTYEEAMEYGFCGARGDYDVLTEEWINALTA